MSSSLLIITGTDGRSRFAVVPGGHDGSGGKFQHSDLHFFGEGNRDWGFGFNQNFFRLLENFACPESLSNPGSPSTATDIGIADSGVNLPVEGQTWWNTTTKQLFVFDGTSWRLLGPN